MAIQADTQSQQDTVDTPQSKRTIVLPSWAQRFLILLWVEMLSDVLFQSIWPKVVMLVGYFVFYTATYYLQRSGRIPTGLASYWNRFRTYPVWMLVLVAASSATMLMYLFGPLMG